MKQKDLILVTAYCPTKEKKEVLLEFLKSLNKFRDSYSILLSSHTALDTMFFDYFDYFYYDKNNEILTDIEYIQNGWFSPFDNYVIWTSYHEVGSTLKAIWDLVIPSISIAKSLNYEKIHYIEYDSKIINDDELVDNSKLLDQYDYIIYNTQDTHKMVGAFFSFNSKNVIDEHKLNDKSMYDKLLIDVYPKVPENIFFNLIENQRTYHVKNYNNLANNGIILNKVRGNPVSWNIPYYNPSDNSLKFFSRNTDSLPYDIKVILNDELINIGIVYPDMWKIVDLFDNFDNVNDIIVLKNNEKILEINFQTEEFKDKFKYYNSVLDNKSLGI